MFSSDTSLNVRSRNRPFYILRCNIPFLCHVKILIYPLATPLILLTLSGTSLLKISLLPFFLLNNSTFFLIFPPPATISSCFVFTLLCFSVPLPLYSSSFHILILLFPHHSLSSSSFFLIIPYPPTPFSPSFLCREGYFLLPFNE